MSKFCVMSVEDSYDNIDLIQTLNEQDEEIDDLKQELQRKDNIINELEKYIENNSFDLSWCIAIEDKKLEAEGIRKVVSCTRLLEILKEK